MSFTNVNQLIIFSENCLALRRTWKFLSSFFCKLFSEKRLARGTNMIFWLTLSACSIRNYSSTATRLKFTLQSKTLLSGLYSSVFNVIGNVEPEAISENSSLILALVFGSTEWRLSEIVNCLPLLSTTYIAVGTQQDPIYPKSHAITFRHFARPLHPENFPQKVCMLLVS